MKPRPPRLDDGTLRAQLDARLDLLEHDDPYLESLRKLLDLYLEMLHHRRLVRDLPPP